MLGIIDNNTLFKNLILHVEINGMRNPNIIIKEISVKCWWKNMLFMEGRIDGSGMESAISITIVL
jgi:hypothetical protein